MGLLGSGLGLLLLGRSVVLGSAAQGLYFFLVPVCGLAGVLAALWGARMLKRRVVFPRGGFVAPRRVRSWAIAGVAIVISTRLWPRWLLESRWLMPGCAVAFAAIMLHRGLNSKSWGRVWSGLCIAALGILVAWLSGGNSKNAAWMLIGGGALAACAGTAQLVRFLKNNPTPMAFYNE